MTHLIDISVPLCAQTAVFPGDTKFKRSVDMAIEDGQHLTLSHITTTLHIGTHADAPSHYEGGAASIDRVALDAYVGGCQVIQVRCSPDTRVCVADVVAACPQGITEKRVLLRTDSCMDPQRWVATFNGLTPQLVNYLADAGVVLVGVDTPSVDLASSKDLPAHKQVAARDMRILEGLRLVDVTPGIYELIALPVKIVDGDAAPVRAILRSPRKTSL